MVVLLILNSWELLLKGYLYKFHKDINLFLKDGTTRPFENCLNIVNQKIGKEFNPIQENLNILYEYRNQVAHYYIQELDPIIFSLVSKNIIFYSNFLKKYFKIDISEQSDLVLLPIGFKRPISPIDFISAKSINEKTSIEVKSFLQSIIKASQRLKNDQIEDTIFVDFRMNLINVNRTTNADFVAGIDNARKDNLVFTVNKEPKKVMLSKEGREIILTRDREKAHGTLYYEELHEGIFDEINNIVDANRILAKGNHQFMLGAALYYRIYSERQHVNFNIDTFDILARAGSMDFYSPFLYWLTKLPPKNIVDILFDLLYKFKSPSIHNLIKIVIIIDDEAVRCFTKLFDDKLKDIVQKPDFYYTFMAQNKLKVTNPILKALKASSIKVLIENLQYGQLLKDINLPLNFLSKTCLEVFKGDVHLRSITRELDYLAYGKLLITNEQIINEILSRR